MISCVCVALGIEPKASHLPGKHSTSELKVSQPILKSCVILLYITVTI